MHLYSIHSDANLPMLTHPCNVQFIMFYFVTLHTSRACHVCKKNTFFEYKFNNMEDVNIVFWTFKLDVIMSSSGRVRSRKQTGGHLWYYDWRHVHIPAGLCSCTVKYLSQHARAFFPWWLWPLNSLNLIRSTNKSATSCKDVFARG